MPEPVMRTTRSYPPSLEHERDLLGAQVIHCRHARAVPMRILVTGATGFLGGAVSRRLLSAGHDVTATGRDPTRGQALSASGLRFEPADLCDQRAVGRLCDDVDAVVHCAALSSPWGPKQAFVQANVQATATLIAACRTGRVRRLVHISTPSIYMGRGDRELVREDDPLPRPINQYAATKLKAERLVLAAHAAGLPCVVLRPRAIFGPGDTTIFPRLIRALEGGMLPMLGDGLNRVDLTYIDNVVQAVDLALSAPASATGQAYNITNGEPVRLWEVVSRVCHALGLPPPRGRLPRPAGMVLGAALEMFHAALRPNIEPKLTRYTVQVLSCTMTLDITRARRQLGYEPLVSVDEGLTHFIDWWKQSSCRT